MKNQASRFVGFLLFLTAFFTPSLASAAEPKLVLSIVVDQLRADYLFKLHDRFIQNNRKNLGGFTYLEQNGAYFPQAQYSHWYCVTAAGHATIYTGASPDRHGIPLNTWWDEKSKTRVAAVNDPEFPVVGKSSKPTYGYSPRMMSGSTLGDELKARYPQSKVVSLALKDRGAILPGGKRPDFVMWFDSKSYQWNSSKYYRPDGTLPEWVNALNSELAQTPEPHRYENISTPIGYQVTLQAVQKAFREYNLGRGKTPDLLAVSISNFDYAGHQHGAESEEMVKMTLALDRLIAQILQTAQREVPGGLSQVLVVLTSDHGMGPHPDLMKSLHFDAGRISEKELVKKLEERFNARFGKPSQNWIDLSRELAIQLNPAALAERKVKSADVEEEAKLALDQMPGVFKVITAHDIQENRVGESFLSAQIRKSYVPRRSGEIFVLPMPYYIKDEDQATHMTGYAYDRTVPLFFAGPGIRKGRYLQNADMTSIAPTLSARLGLLPPATSEGQVLSEILK